MAELTNQGHQKGNPLLAILLGSLGPVIVVIFLFLLISHGNPDIHALMLVGTTAIAVASIGVMVIGLPAHAFLSSRNWTGYWHYIAAGMISGVALSLLTSHSWDPGDYWLNFYGLCPCTIASAIGLRLGLGKP